MPCHKEIEITKEQIMLNRLPFRLFMSHARPMPRWLIPILGFVLVFAGLAQAQDAAEVREVTEVQEVTEAEQVGAQRVELREDVRVEVEPVDTRTTLEVPDETIRPESAQDPTASSTPRPASNRANQPAAEDRQDGGLTNLFGGNNTSNDSNRNDSNQPASLPTPTLPGIPAPPPLPADQLENATARLQAYRQIVQTHYNTALEIALATAESQDPFLRSNAIEALQPDPARVLMLVRKGIDDPAPVVRFASLMTIGELKIRSLGPVAITKLDDPSASVRAAAIYAAYENDQRAPLNVLPHLLSSESSSVRRNVCLVLEKIGDPSAVPMILDMATRRNRKSTPLDSTLVSVIAAKTVVALGDDSEIEVVRASMYSSYPEVQVIAIMALGELEDRVMQPAIEQMLRRQMPQQAPEINLAAAYALAKMGSEMGLGTMLKFANMQVIEFDGRQYSAATLRAQAAAGLKWIQDPRSATQLGRLLEDPNPRVRIAAADAIIAAHVRLNKDINLP